MLGFFCLSLTQEHPGEVLCDQVGRPCMKDIIPDIIVTVVNPVLVYRFLEFGHYIR